MNGKGSNPRKFTKRGHQAVLKNWDDPYPKRKAGRPGKTTYVWKDGKLVDKERLNVIDFPPVPTEYVDQRDWLQRRVLEQYGAPKEVLGAK
jgi:hypothetical protein